MSHFTRTYIEGNTYPVKEQLKEAGCRWDKDRRSWYAETAEVAAKAAAIVGPTPLYNSPPPQDLGTVDAVELAAKFGRTAVVGATVKSFTVYGLGKGDNGDPNGTVVRGRGNIRYVQVARTERRYYSRDTLEDLDLFGEQPGGSYQWDGVEVEPNEAERAEDLKAAEAKAGKERAAAEAKAAMAARWLAAIEGLQEITVPPASYTKTGERLEISDKSYGEQIRLPDGRIGWARHWSGYDDSRTYYSVPADVVQPILIAWASECGITPEKAAEWLAKYSGCHGTEIYRAVVESDEATKEELRQAAVAKRAADLAHVWEDERRSIRVNARHRLEDEGWIVPEGKLYIKPPVRAVQAVGWDVTIPDTIEPYVVARLEEGDIPQAEGVIITLRFPAAAWDVPPKSPRSKKPAQPAPIEAVPKVLKLHNFCTAAVVIEKAD
jgi:hypothetical protein